MQQDLSKIAWEIRKKTFQAITEAGGGHYGGSLSISEMLAVLYFGEMNMFPEEPLSPKRDRFILSKGHAGPALYTTLAERGFFPFQDLLEGLDRPLSKFPKHIDRLKLEGIEASTGPLGQGLSIGTGMALTFLQQKKQNRVYVLAGDGECDSGQLWEAVMTAAKYRLANLILFIDRNELQIDGSCGDIMPTDPLDEKFEAFGWITRKVDGHDVGQIRSTVTEIKELQEKDRRPAVIVACTVKGYGISFMENKAQWHSGSITPEQYKAGMAELEARV